jgi:hypothetical protein
LCPWHDADEAAILAIITQRGRFATGLPMIGRILPRSVIRADGGKSAGGSRCTNHERRR